MPGGRNKSIGPVQVSPWPHSLWSVPEAQGFRCSCSCSPWFSHLLLGLLGHVVVLVLIFLIVHGLKKYFIVVQLQLSPFHPHYSPLPYLLPAPTLNSLASPRCHCPWVLYTCSLVTLPLLCPVIPLSVPLWLLSICSLFPCLWLYFAHLFVLMIRFHLSVRLYGIVFHHLAYFT